MFKFFVKKRDIASKLEKTGYRNEEMCKKCGGVCCKNIPGAWSPWDLGKTKKEIIKNAKKLINDNLAMVERNNIYGTYLIPQITKKGCVFLTENGCKLPFEKRPTVCRNLEPCIPRKCKQHFGEKKVAKEWKKFNINALISGK